MSVRHGGNPRLNNLLISTCRGALIATLLVVVATTPARAQSELPLTMAEAEDLALAAEPGRLALEAQADALNERAVVAGALPDPMLRVGLNNFPIESGGFSTEGMTQLAASYRQVFPAGKTRSMPVELAGCDLHGAP